MSLTVLWCDEFVRLDPLEGAALDGENQAPDAPPVRLVAARGAAVSFQLLVGPLKGGREALVGPGGLSGPGEARIPSTQFDVFVEWYHRIDEKWWPDALVPQDLSGGSTPALRRQMDLPGAARFAGFWLDLHVPADAKPGAYTGSIAVRSGDEVVQVPVELAVAAAAAGEALPGRQLQQLRGFGLGALPGRQGRPPALLDRALSPDRARRLPLRPRPPGLPALPALHPRRLRARRLRAAAGR
jgi:hypothetical protein